MRLICLFVGTVLRICVVKCVFYYPNNLISAKYASFALSKIEFFREILGLQYSCQTWWLSLSLCLLGLLKMFDIPAGARHIVIEENETSPHVIGEFVPVLLFSSGHASHWDQLLPSHHALCAIWDSPASPSLDQAVCCNAYVCISSFSLTWIPELMFSFCWKPDLLSEKIWSV